MIRKLLGKIKNFELFDASKCFIFVRNNNWGKYPKEQTV